MFLPDESSMDILKTILFFYAGVVLVNALVALALWVSYRKPQFKNLFGFWASFFVSFLLQGAFQVGNLPIVLSYCSYFIPVMFIIKIIKDARREEVHFKSYWTVGGLSVLLSLVISQFTSLDFLFVAMPPTLVMSYFLVVNAVDIIRHSSGIVSKIYGGVLVLNAIHFLDYPFLRPNPEYAILGFSIALLFVVSYSILMPAFVIERVTAVYTNELEDEVEKRTRENKALISILSHDISNLATVLDMSLNSMFSRSEDDEKTPRALKVEKRISNATHGIMEILSHVKEMQALEYSQEDLELQDIDPKPIITELVSSLEEQLEKKKINMVVDDQLDDGVLLKADQSSLKNQVLRNFLSNALKFSFEASEVIVSLKEINGRVLISIKDSGKGMGEDLASKLFSFESKTSTRGTAGERGTGLGMPIAKKYLDIYGAEIKIDTKPFEEGEEGHGTNFSMFFLKSA